LVNRPRQGIDNGVDVWRDREAVKFGVVAGVYHGHNIYWVDHLNES
jgi:hypothetical protein